MGLKQLIKPAGIDDNIGNGFDKNIGLKIKKVKQLTVKEDVLDLSEISEAYEVVWDNVVFPVDENMRLNMLVTIFLLTIRLVSWDLCIKKRHWLCISILRPWKKETKDIKFTAGTYRIAAMVQQKKIKEVKKGKLLSFALNIKTKGKVSFELDQSWQENPLGVALTIKVSNQKLELEDGRIGGESMSSNPLWSMRFKTNKSKKSVASD